MIDAMFQEGTDKVLDDQIQRPAPFKPDAPGFSLWGLPRGAGRGVAGGVLNTGAAAAEIAGAFGEVTAATGAFGSGGMFAEIPEEERRQNEEARRKLIERGAPEFSNPAGDTLRSAARAVMPDPTTAHASEQMIAGGAQFLSQGLTYAATTGPAAPFLLAGDVGLAEADRLKQQGVDIETRTKAGAVAGVSAGIGLAVPVTIAGSKAVKAAYGAATGASMFSAQNAVERAILRNAGYEQIASTYDPFDPLGLLVSALVPAGFGVLAGRGARIRSEAQAKAPLIDLPAPERTKLPFNDARLDAYAVEAATREGIPPEALLAIKNAGERSGSTATSPAGARGVMQFMPDTWKAYGKGDITDPVASIDAGARYMRDLIQQYNGDVRAAIAHYNGGSAAGRAVREGRAPPAAETRAYLARTDEYTVGRAADIAAKERVAADPDVVAAARVRQTLNAIDSYRLSPDSDLAGQTAHTDAMEVAHAQLAAGERVDVSDILALDSVRTGRLLDDMIATGEDARAALLPEAGNLADAGTVRQLRADLDQLRASRPDDSPAAIKARAKELQEGQQLSYKRATAAAEREVRQALETHDAQIQRIAGLLERNSRAQQATEQLGQIDRELEGLRAQRGEVDAPSSSPRSLALAVSDIFRPRLPAAPRLLEATPARSAAPAAAGEARPAAAPAPRPPAAAPRAGAEPTAGQPSPALEAQSAAALEINPDLMVQLEGMDAPVRAADLLAQVKKEAADETRDSSLIDVAANCFLRNS